MASHPFLVVQLVELDSPFFHARLDLLLDACMGDAEAMLILYSPHAEDRSYPDHDHGKTRLQSTIQAGTKDGALRRLINVRRETMAAVSRINRDRGIHEETSTGTTYNIGTAMPMGSHQSTARIPPIRAAVIPQVRKLDRPVLIGLAPLFALLYYSPHLTI